MSIKNTINMGVKSDIDRGIRGIRQSRFYIPPEEILLFGCKHDSISMRTVARIQAGIFSRSLCRDLQDKSQAKGRAFFRPCLWSAYWR